MRLYFLRASRSALALTNLSGAAFSTNTSCSTRVRAPDAAASVDKTVRVWDAATRRFESEAEGIDHVFMPRRKCRDRDVSVLVDNAWHDLVRVDFAAGRSFSMKAVTARGDVDLPGLESSPSSP